ncbi:MAG TPA: hypothetical protein VGO58_15915 [Chitinophagaceae bacterium]|jgi:hypothetical protein|nr:hypothetical protein [Chitinophagaceae bacterium]
MKRLFPIIVVLFASFGCSKDKDTQNPVILLTTPTLGQVFTNGASIQIIGTVTDDKIVNEVLVRVTNAVTGAVIIEFTSTPQSPSTSLNYMLGANSGIHYRLQVIAKDGVRNDARVTVEFTCN